MLSGTTAVVLDYTTRSESLSMVVGVYVADAHNAAVVRSVRVSRFLFLEKKGVVALQLEPHAGQSHDPKALARRCVVVGTKAAISHITLLQNEHRH